MFKRPNMCGMLLFSFLFWAAGCGAITEKTAENPAGQNGGSGRLEAASVGSDVLVRPTYRMYSDDLRLIKQAARQIPGVRDSAILLNGPDAYVTLQLNAKVLPENAMRIRNQAQTSLQRIFPRYNVKVSVGTNELLPSGMY